MPPLLSIHVLCPLNAQMDELAGDRLVPGSIRSRQTWFSAGDAGELGLSREREGGSPLIYDLQAVVVHRGSAHHGHYHAMIRDGLDEVCVWSRVCLGVLVAVQAWVSRVGRTATAVRRSILEPSATAVRGRALGLATIP